MTVPPPDRQSLSDEPSVRRNPLPWIDADTRKLMSRRNQLRNVANQTASEEAWKDHRSLRNKVTGNLRRANCTFFDSLVTKSSTMPWDNEAVEQAPRQK